MQPFSLRALYAPWLKASQVPQIASILPFRYFAKLRRPCYGSIALRPTTPRANRLSSLIFGYCFCSFAHAPPDDAPSAKPATHSGDISAHPLKSFASWPEEIRQGGIVLLGDRHTPDPLALTAVSNTETLIQHPPPSSPARSHTDHAPERE